MKKDGTVPQSPGSLPSIIRNDDKLYEGDLIPYYQVLFNYAQNLHHPYHNFRHMFHVLWLCYQACLFYRTSLSPRKMRDLLVAALFHDFNHSGMMGNDDLNIIRAIRELRQYVVSIDVPYLDDISGLIRATEYPYVVPVEKLDIRGKILRDADVSQALSVAWLQQVVFGLAKEWNRRPLEVLKMQESFLKGLTFHTEWALRQFPEYEIQAKIKEAQELFELLEIGATKPA